MDHYDETWDDFSDDDFSDDDADTSSAESTDEPLTLRDGSVRDISVDGSLSEDGEGASTDYFDGTLDKDDELPMQVATRDDPPPLAEDQKRIASEI
eukprot:10065858-Heterocapsa_arctica.AAC.1